MSIDASKPTTSNATLHQYSRPQRQKVRPGVWRREGMKRAGRRRSLSPILTLLLLILPLLLLLLLPLGIPMLGEMLQKLMPQQAMQGTQLSLPYLIVGNGDNHCKEKKLENTKDKGGLIAPSYVALTKAKSNTSDKSGAEVEEGASKTMGSSAPLAKITEDSAASCTFKTKEGVNLFKKGNALAAAEKEGNLCKQGNAKPLLVATQCGDIVMDKS